MSNSPTQVEIALIAAIDENNAVGKNGEIPWDYPEDLHRFRSVTVGSPVIMGRVTYEGIIEATGGPLENRTSIVLTNSPEQIDTKTGDGGISELATATTVHTVSRVEEALAVAGTTNSDVVYVAGGGSVYEQYLPVADTLILTRINAEIDGADTYFPDWDANNWVAVDAPDASNADLSFERYERSVNDR